MSTTVKFTSADLALMQDDGKRYEIIEESYECLDNED